MKKPKIEIGYRYGTINLDSEKYEEGLLVSVSVYIGGVCHVETMRIRAEELKKDIESFNKIKNV